MSTNYYNENEEHIGKKSSGWPFLFKDRPQFTSIEKAKEWIKSHQIISENGAPISFEDFWSMVENGQKEPRRHKSTMEPNEVRYIEGFAFLDAEFC